MTIIHITEQDNKLCNGIKTVITSLYREQEKLGHTVIMLNLFDNEKKVVREERHVDSLSTFRKLIQQIRPDIVVFHSIYRYRYFGFASYLVSKHIPYLIEPHGGTTCENQLKSRWKKRIANVLWVNNFIKEASAIIYLNEEEQNHCIFADKQKQGVIIPNGVFVPSVLTSSKVESHKIRFMFLARIDIHHKGLDLLLDSLQEMCKNGYADQFEFHFYGDTDKINDLTYFEKRLAEIKGKGNFFYHGIVEGNKKEEAFRNADIYVLTSRYEGMPMSVLEALSYGKPCIVTPQTNMQKLIEKNDCGWITQTESHAIASTLLASINEFPKKRIRYEENARKAIEPYTWDTIANRTISVYQSFIDNQK